MRCGETLSGAAVLALAVAGCFTEPGGLGDDAHPGGSGHSGAGGAGMAGGGGIGGGGGWSGSGAAAGHAPMAGTGGSSTAGTGGSGTAGAAGACPSATACGGDLVGTWSVSSSCLVVKGSLDISGLGLGCASAGVRGSRAVAGNFITNADGTYVDQTTTSGEELIELPEACLSVSGTLVTCDRLGPVLESFGYDSVTCVPDGGGCQCNAVFEQTSGLGVLSIVPSSRGSYETSGTVMTLVSDENTTTRYQYCVSGEELTVLPQTSPTDSLRGTIVLARQ